MVDGPSWGAIRAPAVFVVGQRAVPCARPQGLRVGVCLAEQRCRLVQELLRDWSHDTGREPAAFMCKCCALRPDYSPC